MEKHTKVTELGSISVYFDPHEIFFNVTLYPEGGIIGQNLTTVYFKQVYCWTVSGIIQLPDCYSLKK